MIDSLGSRNVGQMRMHIGRMKKKRSMILTLRLLCVFNRLAESESSIYGWRKLRAHSMFRACGFEQRQLKFHHDSRVTYLPPKVPLTCKDYRARTGKSQPLWWMRKQCTTIHLIKHIIDKNEKDEYRHFEFLALDNLMLSAGLLSWCLSLTSGKYTRYTVVSSWSL